MAFDYARPPVIHVADWVGLIRAEYLESPGLQLTLVQAGRFWGIDDLTIAAIFAALTDAKFLKQIPGGAFVRATGD